MCFAILGVIMYHLCLRGVHTGRLNIGYMGVDVFMLLSGYGIAKSLSRIPIKQFYINRTRRIFPLWAIMIIVSFFVDMLFSGGGCNISLLLGNVTTLSFYYNPDLLPEWYLSTLILFYVLSPILKKLLEKVGWGLLVMISLAVILEEEILGTGRWQYANAIARIPLYLLGMWCAFTNKIDLPYKVTIPLFFLSIIFFFQNQHYLFSASAVLFLVQILNKIIDRWSILKNSLFNWIGSHTLEIYVGNVISAVIVYYIFYPEMHVLTKISIDLMITIGLSLLLWRINSVLQKQI